MRNLLAVTMQYKPHAKSAKAAKKGTKRCFPAQDFLHHLGREIGSSSFNVLCGLRDLCVRPPSTTAALLRLSKSTVARVAIPNKVHFDSSKL